MMSKECSTIIVNFMTPRAGIVVLGCGHISNIVKKKYVIKSLLLYSKAQIRQTEGKVMMSQEGSTKIVNFINPRAEILVLGCGHESVLLKIHYFLNCFSLLPGTDQQAEVIVMMTHEGSTKIVNFMTPRDSCARVWP